ncbi:MAG: VWA domain-containing protein [Sandaracinaceae bacterium]|nr:VWA domain-containing protein [Sandaracinaceae bacterium]
MAQKHRTSSPVLSISLLVGLATASVGCGSGLNVNLVDGTHAQPSNVAMFFTVDDAEGEPVGGLAAESFVIYEDDQRVSPSESQQTIINQEVAAEHFTLLLVDMSGSVTESDWVPAITAAATEFTAAVEAQQQVGVYAFDGSEEIFEMQPFRRNRDTPAQGVARLGSFQTRDPSTNLNGALVQAAATLTAAMATSEAPLRFGTIVVFTDGTDRAARVSQGDAVDALEDGDFDVFAIGVGSEIAPEVLGDIGISGYVLIEDTASLTQAFTTIGERIVGQTRRFYLLSYCSPARAGTHEVRVEANQGELSGDATYSFDATGFGPDCDPNRPPAFEAASDQPRPRTARRGGAIRLEVRAE